MNKKIPLLIALIGFTLLIIFGGDMVENYHGEGSTKYLKQLGYTEIECLDALFMSKSLKYEVFSKKENKTDTVYIDFVNGGYTIRYFEYIP